MTTPPPPGHVVEPDGYCLTCQTVPCARRTGLPVTAPGSSIGQLARIELKLNRLLRALGLDPDVAEPAAPAVKLPPGWTVEQLVAGADGPHWSPVAAPPPGEPAAPPAPPPVVPEVGFE